MAATMTSFAPWNLTSLRTSPSTPPTTSRFFKPANCSPIIQQQQQQEEADVGNSVRGLQRERVAALRLLQRAENEREIRDQANLPAMPILQSYWSGVVFKVQGFQMCHIPKLQ
ncbi:uncharacterized protein LOC103964517 [Pyrus x bretschneideri]|uniref:uncharacterized protein LOC103964517 n=1 Tax=Pyrus x bretschneideri TaxID=225117 RepID=UPI00202F1404|nr:uncharacterized protein LOC103964517 [Pyrus x bretschneideri]